MKLGAIALSIALVLGGGLHLALTMTHLDPEEVAAAVRPDAQQAASDAVSASLEFTVARMRRVIGDLTKTQQKVEEQESTIDNLQEEIVRLRLRVKQLESNGREPGR